MSPAMRSLLFVLSPLVFGLGVLLLDRFFRSFRGRGRRGQGVLVRRVRRK